MRKVAFTATGKRRQSSTTRLVRCLGIVRRLQDGPAVSVRTLARIWSVDDRSIQRDLKVLQAVGYNLEIAGKPGWYKLVWRPA